MRDRLESRGRNIIREFPDAQPGEYLIFNQNNGAVFAGNFSMDGYGAVGLLWLLHAATEDPRYREYAQRGARIFDPLADVLGSHSGVAIYRSAVWGYQLTGDEELKRAGLRAAATMSRFFDPRNEVFGRHPGAPAEAAFPAGGVKHRFHSVHAPANTPARATHIDWSGFWFEVLWWAGKYDSRFSDQARRHCDAYLRPGVPAAGRFLTSRPELRRADRRAVGVPFQSGVLGRHRLVARPGVDADGIRTGLRGHR